MSREDFEVVLARELEPGDQIFVGRTRYTVEKVHFVTPN